MTQMETLNSCENRIFGATQNDVVPEQQSTMATEAPTNNLHGERMKCDGTGAGSDLLSTAVDSYNNGVAGVSALSLNESTKPEVVTEHQQKADGNGAQLNNNGNKGKGKRRRRKTKSKLNGKPFRGTSNWKFQLSRASRMRGGSEGNVLSTLVPYNTNKFLMEEHMPEIGQKWGHQRDSSYSQDSDDNNQFPSMSEDEEFLRKEFSSVYEDARSERLEGMSRSQLIQEYLQLEANYNKLSKNLDDRNCEFNEQQQMEEPRNLESQRIICKLEEKVKELTAENLEIRRQMADIRNRRQRSRSANAHKKSHTVGTHRRENGHSSGNNTSTCSEDSESDSSSSTSSSSSSKSRSSISSNRSEKDTAHNGLNPV